VEYQENDAMFRFRDGLVDDEKIFGARLQAPHDAGIRRVGRSRNSLNSWSE
jgi:hypothetical protein